MARPKESSNARKGNGPSGDVDAFLAGLDHPLKADIGAVREQVLAARPAITEGIKWNAPSFRNTDWFATFHLRSRASVSLVMHTGAKTKDNPEFNIPDPNGLVKWIARDRALVTLGAGRAIEDNAKSFTAIVRAWTRYV